MAAPKPTCSIDGCNSHVRARGWCRSHYGRWQQHGDPTAGAARHIDIIKFVETVALFHTGDDCLLWPFGRNGRGYAEFTYDGRIEGAHRVICRLAHGDEPSSDMDAAHSCGRGHEGCISPVHLSWKTRSDNFDDRRAHGTWPHGEANPHSSLTADDVREIRGLEGAATQAQIAAKFNIGRQQVGNILRRKSWAHIAD